MTDKLREVAHTSDPDPADIIAGALQTSRAHAYELMHKALAQQDAQEPLITVESSLRFRLDCTKEQLEAAERENAELRGRLRGALAQQDAQALEALIQASKQALEALIQADQRDGMYSYELEIAALREALAQQDAQAVPQGEAIVDEFSAWLNERRGMSVAWIFHDVVAKFRTMLNAAPTPPVVKESLTDQIDNAAAPAGKDQYTIYGDGFHDGYIKGRAEGWDAAVIEAQQDAQAVVQEPCAVVKWQTGGPVVHIIGDVQAGDLLYRAAPTPPTKQDAQAVPQPPMLRWRELADYPAETGRYIVAHCGQVGGHAYYTAREGDTHYPVGWAQLPDFKPTHWLDGPRIGTGDAMLNATHTLPAQQGAQAATILPPGCTHYTRTGDERITLQFESEAAADAWQDAAKSS